MDHQPTCRVFSEEPWKCDVILIVQRVVSAISLLSCCFVIFIIWLFKRFRATPQRMVLFVAISGAFYNLVKLIAFSQHKPSCRIIGFFATLFSFTMLLWAFAISIQLFLATYYHSYSRKYEWMYHYVIWTIALVLSLSPFFENVYGDSGVWCWMLRITAWRMGVYYVPVFIILFISLILYIAIIVKIRKIVNGWQRTYSPDVEAHKQFLNKEVRPLVFYPLVYILLYIIPLINRIQNAVGEDAIFELFLISSICTSLMGAANSLVFGLDQETRSKLSKDHFITAWHSHFTPEVKIGLYDTERPPGGGGLDNPALEVEEPHGSQEPNPVFKTGNSKPDFKDETKRGGPKSSKRDIVDMPDIMGEKSHQSQEAEAGRFPSDSQMEEVSLSGETNMDTEAVIVRKANNSDPVTGTFV